MAKRPDMKALLAEEAGSHRGVEEAPTAAPVRKRGLDPANTHFRPGRAEKTNVTGYFPPEVKKQLKLIAAEEDKTVQQLLGEALNLMFVKYHRAEIAPTDRG